MDISHLTDEEIIEKYLNKEIKIRDLVDSGICPTCFDKNHNSVIYGNKDDKMLYEDDLFECFLDARPKALAHTIISTKKHFKDTTELDDETCIKAYLFAKKVMIAIKEVYKPESVYICSMCDGPANHFHIQLIPRYSNENRGSKNFVKPRQEFNNEKIDDLREAIKKAVI